MKGFSVLHVAVSSQKSTFELPKIEELLIKRDKSLLKAYNKQGYEPLH